MFYKSQHALVALPLPNVVQLPIRPRPRYPHAFQVPYCSTDAYKFSFFPCTVVQWNKLPALIAMAPSLDQSKGAGTTLCLITTSLCTVHTPTPPLPPPPQTFPRLPHAHLPPHPSSLALPLPTRCSFPASLPTCLPPAIQFNVQLYTVCVLGKLHCIV